MGAGGPVWVVLTVSGIGLVGVLITAVAGPVIVERFKSSRTTFEPSEPEMIKQRAGDGVKLIESSIDDLRNRVGRLEEMHMKNAHGQHG